jgi:hypothetical protein
VEPQMVTMKEQRTIFQAWIVKRPYIQNFFLSQAWKNKPIEKSNVPTTE